MNADRRQSSSVSRAASVEQADAQQGIDGIGDSVAAERTGLRGLGVCVVFGPFVEDAQGPGAVEVIGECFAQQADDVLAQTLSTF